ncbi:MAG: MCP four helix bundle domain-containing protein, partial [Dehalococcoidia bacterium]|nr:MCP four helix bundle domain-containing protein [Dehalococcoidia bacterium]
MTLGFREKVLGIIAAMAAVFVVLGAVGWFWISSSLRAVDNVEAMSDVLATVGQTSRRMTEVRASVVAHVGATTNADYRKQLDARIADLDQQIAADLDTLVASAHTSDEQRAVQNLRDAWTAYRAAAQRTLELSRRYDLVAAQQNMTSDGAQKFEALLQAIRDLEEASRADAAAAADQAQSQLSLLRYAMLGAAGLAVVAFVVGFAVLRPALRTVGAVARASEQ